LAVDRWNVWLAAFTRMVVRLAGSLMVTSPPDSTRVRPWLSRTR
jgi:hypothetical protein